MVNRAPVTKPLTAMAGCGTAQRPDAGRAPGRRSTGHRSRGTRQLVQHMAVGILLKEE